MCTGTNTKLAERGAGRGCLLTFKIKHKGGVGLFYLKHRSQGRGGMLTFSIKQNGRGRGSGVANLPSTGGSKSPPIADEFTCFEYSS